MNLIERDKKHLWHPLTQHQLQPDSLPIVKAKGVILYGEDGNQYIDAIASWYTSMYGHCHDDILHKVTQQMHKLDQIVFAGFTHEPAIELSEKLITLLPENQNKIFFSDNGSTANEVAIKMAIQYHLNRGLKKQTIIAFENAFHGDTFGAMSVSGLSVYNGAFSDLFIDVVRLEVPDEKNFSSVLKNLEMIISTQEIAAFIYEPLVQGANAMHMFEAEYLDEILGLCQHNKILCIADEVMTGFGKTGKTFASDYMHNKPDIICLSKALTAGFVPMAITSCTQEIYDSFLDDSTQKAFFHAHTYTANPIACAAALAGIELLNSQEIQSNIKNISQSHKEFAQSINSHAAVKSTRYVGVILAIDLAIELSRYGKKRNEIFDFFMSQGVYLRPLGNTIYILPAYIISEQQLAKIYKTIVNYLNSVKDKDN
jgi:adenosylmethionine-8-amino-7-oxononanoate aminotransferase